MIISITGKPCSGKGTVAKIICDKYNFEYICTGDIFRKLALENGYGDVLTYQQQNSDIKKIDKMVDDKTIKIGKTRLNDNIVFDSRMAWHFIPNSFKVFVDIDWKSASKRLLDADRQSEKTTSLKDAEKKLKDRWNLENDRYLELYGVNNLDTNKYDFVISSKNKTPEQIASEIMTAYFNKVKLTQTNK